MQYFGAIRLSHLFGPVMAIWFATLAVSGGFSIWHAPTVLVAVNPAFGVALLIGNPSQALIILGAVFLCVTGGEALYADLGEFGRGPIQRGWFLFVGPALLINYAGQAAFLSTTATVPQSTFYALFPLSILPAVVVLATLAAIIASQAVITGLFGLTTQAIAEDFLPTMPIKQMDSLTPQDVMLPWVNLLLAVGSIGFVLSFQTSAGLAAVYGLAVAGAMITTTVLFAIYLWQRSRLLAVLLVPVFGIDATFFVATLGKFSSGGWVPVMFAALAASVSLHRCARTK